MNRHVYLAPNEAGEKLILTSEQEHVCKVVYRKIEATDKWEEGYVFHGLWDPEANYADDCIILPLRSVYDSMVLVNQGVAFSNVLGSTDDPMRGSSWIAIYTANARTYHPGVPFVYNVTCVTDGRFYSPITGRAFQKNGVDITCHGSSVGGHILGGTVASELLPGSDVYIVPICHRHNSKCFAPAKGNGNGFFMVTGYTIAAMKLRNYMQLPHQADDKTEAAEEPLDES